MKYIFDTDVLSVLLRKQPSDALKQRLARLAPTSQFTTTITVGELSYGAHKIGRLDLLARVRQVIASVGVLPFDSAAAEVYGPLRARLEKKGRKLDEADLRIASIAMANDCRLVTGNVRHFARIEELEVEDWLR